MTGNALDYEVAEFMKSGATMIWTKPLDISKLHAAIKEAIDAAPASHPECAVLKDSNINSELRTKLALKRAALQLATVL